jgi:hypothetical protein
MRILLQVGQHPRIDASLVKKGGWVIIPEWWVNINQNSGSTWIRIYTECIALLVAHPGFVAAGVLSTTDIVKIKVIPFGYMEGGIDAP